MFPRMSRRAPMGGYMSCPRLKLLVLPLGWMFLAPKLSAQRAVGDGLRPGSDSQPLIHYLTAHPAVYSCALADSLLGPMRQGGTMNLWLPIGSDTIQIHPQPSKALMPSMKRAGASPQPFPAPDLGLIISGRPGQRLVAETPRHPRMALILDDSVQIALGDGIVGSYTGPARLTKAPVAVTVSPMIAIQIARARRGAIVVDADTQRIDPGDLRTFQLFYRFVTCDTIPMPPRKP
jgi:hypothetical protein